MGASDKPDTYTLEPDIYQPYGICSKLNPDGTWDNPGTPEFPLSARAKANISCGYIALARDKRQVPPAVQIEGGGALNSFPLAIARARDARRAEEIGSKTLYATFIPGNIIEDGNVAVTASRLLAGDSRAKATLWRSVVIVGGTWNAKAYGRGPMVDMHDTPIGRASGVLIHANMVEAILGHRLFPPTPQWLLHTLEVIFGLIAAVMFALYSPLWAKLVTLLGLSVILVILQWLTLHLLGVFFEAFVPLLAVFVHSLADRFLG